MVSDQKVIGSAHLEFAKFMASVNQKHLRLAPSSSPQAAAVSAMVNRVSDRVVDASGLRGLYQWETVIVRSREANAFVLPNGKIVVFTGLLPALTPAPPCR